MDGGKHIIFFAHPRARDLRFPMRHGQSAEAGKVEKRVRLNAGGRTIETTLVFEPQGSVLLEVDASGKHRVIEIGFQPRKPVAAPETP